MSPPNLIFWSISRKEIQNPNRNMHLEIDFCEHYYGQMIFLIPGTIGKRQLEKEHPFLTEFVLIMNSCFIQGNAPLVENVNVAQEVNALSKKLFVLSQFYIHFSIFEVRDVSIAVLDNVHLVCISLKVDAYFSPTFVNCPFYTRNCIF